MTRIPVAIVGAGLAGLHSARLLQAARVDFLLIEARDRCGGRVLTVDGCDLGPSWFWPRMQPAIGDLIAELGLAAFEQYSEGDVVFERMSRERPHRCRSVAQDFQSMRLAEGSAALVHALERDLPAGKIMAGVRVTAMKLKDDGIELTIAHADGSTRTIAAEQVIAALPPRLLEATVAFTPAQDATVAQRWRDTPTWMAPHAKFFALYERPFWREVGLCGTAQSMVGPMLEMHDATTAAGEAALFGFLGVAAEQRAALNEEKLAQVCLEQFARLFGDAARTPRATLLKDWAADPLTATVMDRMAGGHMAASNQPWVLGAWQKRLALAGSETSPSEPGYLAGAIIAAQRAVAGTLTELG